MSNCKYINTIIQSRITLESNIEEVFQSDLSLFFHVGFTDKVRNWLEDIQDWNKLYRRYKSMSMQFGTFLGTKWSIQIMQRCFRE